MTRVLFNLENPTSGGYLNKPYIVDIWLKLRPSTRVPSSSVLLVAILRASLFIDPEPLAHVTPHSCAFRFNVRHVDDIIFSVTTTKRVVNNYWCLGVLNSDNMNSGYPPLRSLSHDSLAFGVGPSSRTSCSAPALFLSSKTRCF